MRTDAYRMRKYVIRFSQSFERIFRETKLISADKYKELLYAAAELGKYKIANVKLNNSLQSKSAEIIQLKKVIRNYEKSKESEKQEKNVKAVNGDDEPTILSDKVNNFIPLTLFLQLNY